MGGMIRETDGTMRIAPTLPVQAMKTYGLRAPLATHYRPASCVDVDCEAHANGWRSTFDESTDLGQSQAHYVRRESGRKFVEARTEDGLTVFTFEAGQKCFQPHVTSLEREPLYVVRGGDWRGATTPIARHANSTDWLDDFGSHQEQLADRLSDG